MRTIASFIFLTAVAVAVAQQPPAPATSAPPPSLASDLDRLQAAASQANMDIGHLRIEKWKADGASRQQAQANADSLQRNLSSALPGLIASFRAAPQDLSAGFKLYRNLNVLYDVLASFTESAGAFGPRSDYQELAQQLSVIDAVRRNLADNLETLTSNTQSELNQLRIQVRSLQQAAAAPPPKKVIVDDTAPVKKTMRKKKAGTGSTKSTATGSPATSAKPQ